MEADEPGVPAASTPNNFRIGSTNRGEFFKGFLAQVRVWEVARSKEQINYQMKHRFVADEKGLLGFWPLTEGMMTIAGQG